MHICLDWQEGPIKAQILQRRQFFNEDQRAALSCIPSAYTQSIFVTSESIQISVTVKIMPNKQNSYRIISYNIRHKI